MHVRRLLLATAVALAVALPLFTLAPARAQSPDQPPLIAVIDMQRVMQESQAVQSIQRQIEQQRDSYQEQLSQKEQELRQADEELARQRTILSSDAFSKKRRELEQRVSRLQQEIQSRKRRLDQSYSRAMRTVQERLVKIVQDIASKRGIDMVLNKATVVIVRPEMEITETVLTRLNDQLKAVDVPDVQN